jgi:hypothetical protein
LVVLSDQHNQNGTIQFCTVERGRRFHQIMN